QQLLATVLELGVGFGGWHSRQIPEPSLAIACLMAAQTLSIKIPNLRGQATRELMRDREQGFARD
ncbi:MAG: hypothetical protein WAL37_01115, partial [Xanthobacteraceae bacterium]